MIITCEKCETQFNFDPERLGIGGRKLRCTNCKHVWHVNPPEIELSEKKIVFAGERVEPKIRSGKTDNRATTMPDELKKSRIKKIASPSGLKIVASILIILNFVSFIYFNKGIIGQTAFYDTVGNYDTKAVEITSHEITAKPMEKGSNLQIAWSVKNTSTRTLKMPIVRFRLYAANLEQIGEKRNGRENVKIPTGEEMKFKDNLIHNSKKARYFTVEIGNPTELATR